MDLPKKVELGCGEQKQDGWYGVDIVDTALCDQVIDLDSDNWDLPDDHFSQIRAIDVFEHLEEPIQFLEEVFRIAENGATVEIRGPHRSSQNWTDPTHKRLLGSGTFSKYFEQGGDYDFYSDARFTVDKIKLLFMKRPYLPWNYPAEKLFNVSRSAQKYFEVTALSSLFPAQHIYFRLTVQK